jgi:prepilin-type N-terminal cleavage/methylation domain-containing protein
MQSFFNKYNSGFTLIDLMIVIALFGIVTGMVLVNFRAGARNDSVRQAATITGSLLRRAQSMTLSGAVLSDNTFPAGGFGVRFDVTDTTTLILFADIDDNGTYTNSTEQLEAIELPGETVFSAGGNLDVLFSAPDADVLFNGVATEASKTITTSAPSADVTKSIIIYRLSGQVRVQ